MIFEVGKYYRTRAGDKAKILLTDYPSPYSLVGCIYYSQGEGCNNYPDPACSWLTSGRSTLGVRESLNDLLAEWTEPENNVTWHRIKAYRSRSKRVEQPWIYTTGNFYRSQETALKNFGISTDGLDVVFETAELPE